MNLHTTEEKRERTSLRFGAAVLSLKQQLHLHTTTHMYLGIRCGEEHHQMDKRKRRRRDLTCCALTIAMGGRAGPAKVSVAVEEGGRLDAAFLHGDRRGEERGLRQVVLLVVEKRRGSSRRQPPAAIAPTKNRN